jgi:hypothetical protein
MLYSTLIYSCEGRFVAPAITDVAHSPRRLASGERSPAPGKHAPVVRLVPTRQLHTLADLGLIDGPFAETKELLAALSARADPHNDY